MTDDDITPASVAGAFWRWSWIGLAALGLFAILIWAGWQFGWWFTTQNTGRETHVIRNGYSNQQTLRDQITQQIGNVSQVTSQIAFASTAAQAADLKAQRAAIAAMACQDGSQVTGDPLPAQQAQWMAANCQAGSVRPGSAYYQVGAP